MCGAAPKSSGFRWKNTFPLASRRCNPSQTVLAWASVCVLRSPNCPDLVLHRRPEPRPAYARIANSMERARDILKTALRRSKDPKAAPAWLVANWHMIAGQQVAGHTRPVTLHEGVFRIQADSLAWKREVETLEMAICERINRAWGGELVHRLRVDEVRWNSAQVSYAEDNRHTPFVRRRGAKRHED